MHPITPPPLDSLGGVLCRSCQRRPPHWDDVFCLECHAARERRRVWQQAIVVWVRWMMTSLIEGLQTAGLSASVEAGRAIIRHQAAISGPALPWNDPARLMKILDAGAYGVICPMVNTPDEAEALVRACKYPPRGYRSWQSNCGRSPSLSSDRLGAARHRLFGAGDCCGTSV